MSSLQPKHLGGNIGNRSQRPNDTLYAFARLVVVALLAASLGILVTLAIQFEVLQLAAAMVIAVCVVLAILLRPDLGFVLMIFAIPFQRVLMASRVTPFDLLVPLVGGAWFVLRAKNARIRSLRIPGFWLLLGYLIAVLISLLRLTQWADSQTMDIALVEVAAALFLGLFYVICGLVCANWGRIEQALHVWVVTATFVGLIGVAGGLGTLAGFDPLLFLSSANGKLTGTFRNSNALALYFAATLPASLILWLRGNYTQRWMKRGLAISILLQAIGMILTASQGTWAALVVSTPVILVALGRQVKILLVYAVLLILGLLVVSQLDLSVYRSGSSTSISFFDFLFIEQGRTSTRSIHLEFTLQAIMDNFNWLFGLGFGGRIGLGAPDGARAQQEHTTLLKLLLEIGIFGLLVFLAYLARLLIPGWRLARRLRGRRQAITLALVCSIIVLMFASFTHDISSNRGLWFLLALLGAAIRVESMAESENNGRV